MIPAPKKQIINTVSDRNVLLDNFMRDYVVLSNAPLTLNAPPLLFTRECHKKATQVTHLCPVPHAMKST